MKVDGCNDSIYHDDASVQYGIVAFVAMSTIPFMWYVCTFYVRTTRIKVRKKNECAKLNSKTRHAATLNVKMERL